MESISSLIKTVNKENLFKIYEEITNKINDDVYIKLIQEKIDKGIDKENNENMIQIIKQLKENIIKYPLDISLYKEQEENIEIKNKNYILNNSPNDFFIFKSYPSDNILIILINNILLSLLNKSFCFKFFFMESFNKSEVDSIIPLNEKIQKILSDKNLNIIENIINNIFIEFTCRDLLTFLGIRRTKGSIDNYIPLDKNILISKFKELNNAKSKLTVGAKALCKHSHRSVTESFWPGQDGKEIEKNLNAEKMLNLFLDECVWINIHLLPHELVIIELRIDKGYGIRWQINDGMFRGFLEPQMEDGHEKGWIH